MGLRLSEQMICCKAHRVEKKNTLHVLCKDLGKCHVDYDAKRETGISTDVVTSDVLFRLATGRRRCYVI